MDNLVFYQTALEKLNPLRYHLDEMILCLEQINLARSFNPDTPPLYLNKIAEAKGAQKDAEDFCTGPIL